jgi:flagellar hook-length control protein FliK
VTVQTPSATTDQSGTPSDGRQQTPTPSQTAQPSAASSSQPASAPTPTITTMQPVAQPASTAPAAPAASVAGTHPGVALDHAIETVRTTIELASRQGYSQARIQLSPPELGDIRIHLQQTADGLVARVVADHASAAQTLQHGGAELRRSLEAAGLPLLRLDIESSDQRGQTAQDPGRTGTGSGRDAGPADDQSDSTGDEPTTQTLTLTLPTGAVVDVLA